MAKKPAIQMTNGIDDIIKGGIAIGRKVAKRAKKLESKFAQRNIKSHPSIGEITKKEAKRIGPPNYPKIPKTRFAQNKLAKKYAKERVVIQNKYDAQYAAEAAKKSAIREKGKAALASGKKVSKEDWQKLQARKYKGK
jgi:hypothetical protein